VAIRERGRGLVSGAVVSGLLVTAAFAGASFLAWFALTPLLAALDRRRENFRALALQGAVFGIVLAAAGLPWRADPSGALLPEGVGGLLEGAFRAAPGWIVLALAGAAFGLAAGGLLGMRTRILAPTIAPAIAVTWAGLEALLALCPPGLSPWPGGWLALGHAIPPEYPEAQLARITGVSGLSLAVALSSAFLHAGLRPDSKRWMIRFLFLALSLGIPFACRWTGSAAPSDDGGTVVMAGAVSAPGNDLDRIVSLAEAMTLNGPSFVAAPALEGSRTPEELKEVFEARAAGRESPALPLLVAGTESETLEAGEVLLGTHQIGVVHGAGSPAKTSLTLCYLTSSGAEALVIIGRASEPAATARWQRTFDAYRAIECGRHVIRSGAGAAIHAPSGRMLAGISPPLEGSVSTEIRPSAAATPYVEGLYLLGRLLALFAGTFVIGAGLSFRERRA